MLLSVLLTPNCCGADIDSSHHKGGSAPHDHIQLSPPVDLQKDFLGYSPRNGLLGHGAGRDLASLRATRWLHAMPVLTHSSARVSCFPIALLTLHVIQFTPRLSKNEESGCFILHISDNE